MRIDYSGSDHDFDLTLTRVIFGHIIYHSFSVTRGIEWRLKFDSNLSNQSQGQNAFSRLSHSFTCYDLNIQPSHKVIGIFS